MTANSASVTDEALREVGEQVSLAMRKRIPNWGSTSFDIARGVKMYREHLHTFDNLKILRTNDDGTANKSILQSIGKPFEELDAYMLRRDGEEAYTTDELRRLAEDHPLFKRYPKLLEYRQSENKDRKEHGYADVVVIRDGRIKTIQHKNYGNPTEAVTSFLTDYEADEFRVPSDKFKATTIKLKKRIATEKDEDKVKKLKHILENLRPSNVGSREADRPRKTVLSVATVDASKRAATSTASGVMSDMALFAVGGAAMEIREGWQNPDEMTILDRCERLIRAICHRLVSSLKDRSVQEIGSEALVAAVSLLTAPLRMAAAAAERIVEVLSRLWRDFVAGNLTTVADVVTGAFKTLVAVASVGVALAVEAKLTPLFGGIRFGDILAALCAAVVAGVMIVLGNRAIDSVVVSLGRIIEGATAAKRRREEIEALCAEALPQMVADREQLQSILNSDLAGRQAVLDRTFADLQSTRDANDIDGFLARLCDLNGAYGAMLPWSNIDEFESNMLSPEPLKL